MQSAPALAILDRAHVPPPGHPDLAAYKEWWHIALIDETLGLDLIVNLALSGDVHRPGSGRATRILLAHEAAYGWTHDFEFTDGLGAAPGDAALALNIGGATLLPQDETLVLTLPPGPRIRISGQITLLPRTDPLMIWKNTQIGRGRINWFVVPALEAWGDLVIDGRSYRLNATPAYHDHNWGAWNWGDNFGWDWGFAARIMDTRDGWLSLVYDRTTDKNGHVTLEHSLGVWIEDRLTTFFSRRQLVVKSAGAFRGGVARIPLMTGLIDPALPVGIPQVLTLRAEDNDAWIEARFEPQHALQIAIPAEGLPGLAELNETLGLLTLTGRIGDQAFSTRRRACFEFLR